MGGEIPIRERLTRPHALVDSTRRLLAGMREGSDGRLDMRPREGVAYLRVSKAQLRRSLLILQAIFAEAERRGWQVEPAGGSYGSRAGVAIAIRGHAYNVWLTELTQPVALTEPELERWTEENEWRLKWHPELRRPTTRPVASGRLKLSLPGYHGNNARSNWTDGPRGQVESKLAGFFKELERRAAIDDERAVERQRLAAERERQNQQRREHEERLRVEAGREERLLSELDRWRAAQEARRYVQELRTRLTGDLDEQEWTRLVAWCEWIERWVDDADPVTNNALIRGAEVDSLRAPMHTNRITPALPT